MSTEISGQGPNWLVALIQGSTAVPKGVGKLLETIADQIGFSLEPLHIRRRAKAQADAAVTAAKAQAEVAEIQLESKLELQQIKDRAKERVLRKEARRQKNLESIAAKAAREVAESVSEKPVEQDWLAQFFEYCQDVSNEDMQTLWARLLSGEVAQPGSYSYRTLSVVKMLTADVANLFTRFCSFLWRDNNGLMPILAGPGSRFAEEQGLTFVALLLLRQNSLIEFQPMMPFSWEFKRPVPNSPVSAVFNYRGRTHLLSFPAEINGLIFGPALLTDIGRELAGISGSAPIEEYRKEMVDYWRSLRIEVQDNQLG
jgi:hypothetical protein